jgi:hypothetical protein
MRALTTLAVATIATMSSLPVFAQSKTFTGETTTSKATIEAIEQSTRTLTLKNEDGTYEVLAVPPGVQRFAALKVGDTITARYYETVNVRLKPAGEESVNAAEAGMVPTAGAKPAGTLSTQRTITATITAIDPKVPSVSFKGPNGWAYTSRVEDRDVLTKIKVGDRVDITWTKAAVVSID